MIFFALGFLAGLRLLWAVWRRYFAVASLWSVAAGVLALGLANFTPAILQRCDVYEVAISCGCALTMVALLLIWKILQPTFNAQHSTLNYLWLVGVSLAYGLALGARPSLLPGAVILLLPLLQQRQKSAGSRQDFSFCILPSSFPVWLAAVGPVAVVGLGLLLYNYLRFDDPLEFGQLYQLPLTWHQQFSSRFFWSGFQVSFLAPAEWGGRFPFVNEIAVPVLPAGSGSIFEAFGVLSNVPLVWLALVAPLAWRNRSPESQALRWCIVTVAALAVTTVLVLCLHDSMCLRYQVEFASLLLLLAGIGGCGLERALAREPAWKMAARWSWGLLLTFSVVFNLLAIFKVSGDLWLHRGVEAIQKGRMEEASVLFKKALEFQPDNAETHNKLGATLFGQGRIGEAAGYLEQAVRLNPADVTVRNNLGSALFRLGRTAEALAHFEAALQLKPDYPEARNNLRVARYQLGQALAAQSRWGDAIAQFEQAVQLGGDKEPMILDALAAAYAELGRFTEAAGMAQTALALAQAAGHTEEAQRIQERLKSYQAGRPYRNGAKPAP